MSKSKINNGAFWIDGKPVIIHAAEFHYFRIPESEWESRLNLLKTTGFNTLATYIPWLWHEPSEGTFDFDGHSHPMRNLAGFLDLAAKLGLWIIARPGPYIMAETINEGIPPWVFEQVPEVSLIDQKGQFQHYLSYLHPQTTKLVSSWYKAIFSVLTPRQIDQQGTIILVQLDNEIGMINWVRNQLDLNPDNLERFTHFLNQEGVALNSASVTKALCQPDAQNGRFILKAYTRFYRTVIRDYTQTLWDLAKAEGMTVLPVINIHGFGDQGRSFPIGLSQQLEAIRINGMVCATDVYPIHIGEDNFHQLLLVNEMTKALQNKEQALFSIEFEAGGNSDFGGNQSSMTDLHSRLCLSSGMKGINHYLFMDGENFPEISPNKRHDWGHPVRKDGTFRSHYYRYPKLASMIKAYGDALVQAHPVFETTIGFMIDDYLTEYNNDWTKTENETLRHFRNAIQFDGIARALSLLHLNFNALELAQDALDPKKTPTLWIMSHDACPVSVQTKLIEYIRQGGTLVLMGHLPQTDENLNPCTILKDALGVKTISKSDTDKIRAFEYTDIPVGLLQTYKGSFESVFAQSADHKPCGFVQPCEKGKAVVFGCALTPNCLDDLDIYRQITALIGLKPALDSFDWIDMRMMKGSFGNFLVLNNYQDDPWLDTVNRKGKALFEGRPIAIPARCGLVLPMDLGIEKDLKLVYATVELRAIERFKNKIVLHFNGEGYVKIESSVYQVDGSIEADTSRQDIHLKGDLLTLIKKG